MVSLVVKPWRSCVPKQYWPALITGIAAVLAGVSGQLIAGWLSAQRDRARLAWEKTAHEATLQATSESGSQSSSVSCTAAC